MPRACHVGGGEFCRRASGVSAAAPSVPPPALRLTPRGAGVQGTRLPSPWDEAVTSSGLPRARCFRLFTVNLTQAGH